MEKKREVCIAIWKDLYRESFHYFELILKISVDLYIWVSWKLKNLENKEETQDSAGFVNFTYIISVLDPIVQTFSPGHYFCLGSLQFLYLQSQNFTQYLINVKYSTMYSLQM